MRSFFFVLLLVSLWNGRYCFAAAATAAAATALLHISRTVELVCFVYGCTWYFYSNKNTHTAVAYGIILRSAYVCAKGKLCASRPHYLLCARTNARTKSVPPILVWYTYIHSVVGIYLNATKSRNNLSRSLPSSAHILKCVFSVSWRRVQYWTNHLIRSDSRLFLPVSIVSIFKEFLLFFLRFRFSFIS